MLPGKTRGRVDSADLIRANAGNHPIPGKPKDGPKRFTATLPLAPGINSAYKSGMTKDGKSRLYMSPSSVAWKKTAGDLLLEQGWRPLPKGKYTLTLSYTIYCIASRDEDSVQKTLQDVLCKRIGVPDSRVMNCHITKVVVPKDQQRIEVDLLATPLT